MEEKCNHDWRIGEQANTPEVCLKCGATRYDLITKLRLEAAAKDTVIEALKAREVTREIALKIAKAVGNGIEQKQSDEEIVDAILEVIENAGMGKAGG